MNSVRSKTRRQYLESVSCAKCLIVMNSPHYFLIVMFSVQEIVTVVAFVNLA